MLRTTTLNRRAGSVLGVLALTVALAGCQSDNAGTAKAPAGEPASVTKARAQTDPQAAAAMAAMERSAREMSATTGTPPKSR